ncbi:MAG: alpha/beta hydrolase, partial [Bacteroidota bacterium]|nr:alpha/beta hydrolase [Bacteroidota bacterium]
CVLGNLALDSKNLEFDFLSLVGTLPIMLGDPRKLSDNERKMLKSWSTWLRKMQETYDYMVYRQDLPCFGEPTEGHWDGWARINTDTQEGGIIGVFRQGAIEEGRLITINWLKADEIYAVINARDGDIIKEMTGDQLKNEGFRVSMEREYQGKLFEIKKIDKREESKRVFMEEHTTWSFPGRELKALISVPPGPGPFPVVMAIHGGAFNGGNCHRFSPGMHQHFLDMEIAFISVEYRLLKDGGKHPVAIRDCLHNVYWIKDHALDFHMDPERLTVMGSSAGAYLAMMVGLTCNDTLYQPGYGPYQNRTTSIQAVISHAAMYDWKAIEEGESYIGEYRDDMSASSVYLSAGTTTKAFLLLGGEDDVDWSPALSARTMQKRLKKTGSHSELYLREETDHVGLYKMEKEFVRWAFEKIDPFLDKYSK